MSKIHESEDPSERGEAQASAEAKEAEVIHTCLLGSNVQPSMYQNPGGHMVYLGDVVREAFKRSGLTSEYWNALPDDIRERLLQSVVDDWGLV